MTMLLLLSLLNPSPAAMVSIDAAKSKPISPYIYGVNHPEWSGMGKGITLARQGGNRMTAYNWETNASNAGNDFHHQNDNYVGDSNEPGWTVRTFVQAAQRHGAAAIVTVPTAGYVSADKNGDGDVNKTPNYLEVRFLKSFSSKPGGKLVYPPDTRDRAVYQDEFVRFVESIKSETTPVGYSLDNEPDLWASTHVRIRPKNPGYAGIVANNIEYASAIKRVAPRARVFGPANYGWQGFRRFQDAPDADGREFLDVYLAAMREAEKERGRRLVDSLDIHWYPEAQGGGVRIAMSNTVEKPETFEARVQAPRSLWDPTYVETSWITKDSIPGQAIRLIPRVQAQISRHYPGTKLSILEYNYGGANHWSGMLAQADVLGIFGRYGVFAACNWGLAPSDRAMRAGFDAFRDFDGKGAAFGDLGLEVAGQTPESNAFYAALDSKRKGRMTILAINKGGTPQVTILGIRGFRARSVRAIWMGEGNMERARPLDAAIAKGAIRATLPGHSVVRFEVSGSR